MLSKPQLPGNRRAAHRRRFIALAERLESRALLSGINDNFLQGTVFVDGNGDGIPQTGEGQSGIVVNLVGSNGLARSTTTDSNGNYLFDNLPAVDGSGNQITYNLSEVLPQYFVNIGTTAQAQLDKVALGPNSITVQFPTAQNETETYQYVDGQIFNLNLDGASQRFLMGQIVMNVTPVGDTTQTQPITFNTYCVGIRSEMGGDPFPAFTELASAFFPTQKPTGAPIYDGQISYLFNKYGTALPSQSVSIQTPQGSVSITPQEFGMGLQLAIWKMENDTVDFTNPDQSLLDTTSHIALPTPGTTPGTAPFDVFWSAADLIKESANQHGLAMVLNFDKTAVPKIAGQEMLATRNFNFINKDPRDSSSISGAKYLDLTGNGLTPDDPAQGGVTIDLFADPDHNGTLDAADGGPIATTVTAQGTGAYTFSGLNPGVYFVKEEVPGGFTMTTPAANPGYYTVNLGDFQNAGPYNFANYAGAFGKGDTGTIGFWHGNNGNALLLSLNGGAQATNLASWLSTNYPHLFPASLIGTTNKSVVTYFNGLFSTSKLESQVMAVAFAAYVTDANLAGGDYAASYGFHVTQSAGTGFTAYNVGSAGSILGLQNNVNYSIYQILAAADSEASGGQLFPNDTAKRNVLVNLFGSINLNGDI